MKLSIASLALCLSLCHSPFAFAHDAFSTPVSVENLDPATYTEWADGSEKLIQPATVEDTSHKPQSVIWTQTTAPQGSGISYGLSKTPGLRHLRIGFKTAVPVGSMIVRGGGVPSVLKPGAPFPGNVADESQWIAAQRVEKGVAGKGEAGRDEYALWVLPQKVPVRALRFSHMAGPTDREYAGWLGGAWLLPDREANIAQGAIAITSANEKNASRINNLTADPGWNAWDNIALKDGGRDQPVSGQNSEWVMLVWDAPVKLHGLGAMGAGFSEAEAQVYTGPADVHPREAAETAWKTIRSFSGLKSRYPCALGVDWLDFGQEVATRAVRLRITKAIDDNGHPHTKGHAKGGKRVWLGELLALRSLGNADLSTAIIAPPEQKEHPPIPVTFTLPEAGWVTLVIEDSTGRRVRNLIADTFFEKGENTAWWDGSDDLGRDYDAAHHGIYRIPTQLVPPGNYRVRGIWHKQIDLKYQFGIYSAGSTPWETPDKTGGWLANHTPPSAVLSVPDGGNGKPAILIGSYVSEGTAGLAWVDLDGRKWKGQVWVGGAWTGAPYLARDAGPNAMPGAIAYSAVAWSVETNTKVAKSPDGEIRLSAIIPKPGDKGGEWSKLLARYRFTPPVAMGPSAEGSASWKSQISGLAVHNGIAVASLPELNQLVFFDVKNGKTIGTVPLDSPRGLAFDAQGRLHAISARKLVRFPAAATPAAPGRPEDIPATLDDPQSLAFDTKGNIYVGDRGNSHQVKVFTPQGRPMGVFGKPGAPKTGAYDPLNMHNPRGITIDPNGRLWVAEEDFQPKRVSVWNPAGTLWKTFLGPAGYGGGGCLDPQDKTKFYYSSMEFKLDWDKGTSEVASIFFKPGPGDLKLAYRSAAPQTPVYFQGRRYFTNCYNSNPTNGHGTAFIFADRAGIAVPVAAAGVANEWDALKTPALKSIWPQGTDAGALGGPNSPRSTAFSAFFIWSDRNGDGQVQADEVAMVKARSGGVTVMNDLSFAVSRLDDKAMLYAPKSFTAQGVPLYDLSAGETLVQDTQSPPSTGGDQVLIAPDGWIEFTTPPKPFRPDGIAGVKDKMPMWSYPDPWPGLHASHEAPAPDRPGMIIGHTRLLGPFIHPPGSEPMWMLNGNLGPISVLTSDGLLVTQLLQDMRLGRQWSMPGAVRGMSVNDLTPSDENFWPSVTQIPDGSVYLVAGRPNSILQVTGLETVRRIAPFPLALSAEDLGQARDYFARAEAARQAARGRGTITVPLRATPPSVDGNMNDWAGTDWATIDNRGVAAYFQSPSKPYDVTGGVMISGDRLYAAWRTGNPDLLRNSGGVPNAPFKTGGALDLMIGANPGANPNRLKPVEGDERLLITLVNGKPHALLYHAVVPGTKAPVPFTSPVWTINFDRVDDVSDQVQLAGMDGNYEISVPLATLGLKPAPGQVIKGDIGILRGDGSVTRERIYWSNKATAIVSDVPSEAQLQPNLWGRWEFKP